MSDRDEVLSLLVIGKLRALFEEDHFLRKPP
jgi:hypothetical protein